MQMQYSSVDEPATHLRNETLSNFTNRCIVVFDRLERCCPCVRNVAFGPFSPSHEGFIGRYRHDTRNDGNFDAFGSAFLHPVEEDIYIVEHLGDDERCTCVNLLLQMVDQQIYVFLVLTALRISSHADVKMISISGLDVADKIFGISESAFFGLPFLLLSGRITPQC